MNAISGKLKTVAIVVLAALLGSCGPASTTGIQPVPQPGIQPAAPIRVFQQDIYVIGRAKLKLDNLYAYYDGVINCAKLYKLQSDYSIDFLQGDCQNGVAKYSVPVSASGLLTLGTTTVGYFDFASFSLKDLCSGSYAVCTPRVTDGSLLGTEGFLSGVTLN